MHSEALKQKNMGPRAGGHSYNNYIRELRDLNNVLYLEYNKR